MVVSRSAEQLASSAGLLSAVADPIRLQLMERLAVTKACVCELQAEVPIAANLLSYHLKVLREAGLIEGTKRGRWIDYELTPGALDRLRDALPGATLPERPLVVVR